MLARKSMYTYADGNQKFDETLVTTKFLHVHKTFDHSIWSFATIHTSYQNTAEVLTIVID